MSIEISISGVEEALKKLDPERYRIYMARYLEASADLVASVSASLAPRRTGRLSSSIRTSRRGELLYEVYYGAPYTVYVEKGVRPFNLQRPIMIEGVGWRFIKTHPGIKPAGFIKKAIETWRENRKKLVSDLLNMHK